MNKIQLINAIVAAGGFPVESDPPAYMSGTGHDFLLNTTRGQRLVHVLILGDEKIIALGDSRWGRVISMNEILSVRIV